MRHACDYLGHVFHDACIERALRTQMRNDEHRQFVRSYTAMPSGPGRPSSLLGEPLCPGGRCILCRSRVTGLMKLYLPKPRPAALAEQQANKMHEHMAQLREQAHSAAVRSAKLKRHKERLRDQRGKLLAELSRVKSQLSEIEEENEIIILSARTCRRRPPGNQTASIVSSWVALNAD